MPRSAESDWQGDDRARESRSEATRRARFQNRRISSTKKPVALPPTSRSNGWALSCRPPGTARFHPSATWWQRVPNLGPAVGGQLQRLVRPRLAERGLHKDPLQDAGAFARDRFAKGVDKDGACATHVRPSPHGETSREARFRYTQVRI